MIRSGPANQAGLVYITILHSIYHTDFTVLSPKTPSTMDLDKPLDDLITDKRKSDPRRGPRQSRERAAPVPYAVSTSPLHLPRH